MAIGVTVVATFVCLWMPFIKNIDITLQVLSRIFPFWRGLFEVFYVFTYFWLKLNIFYIEIKDKVANFWCSISVLFKIREHFQIAFLSKLSLLLTFLLNLPSGIDLFLRPTRQRFMLALVNSSLIFFLFSFHVHEKSILLVTM